ncbi:phage tail assembly protein [Streptomyces sp. CC210A]|uniref:phage tail assembly protein n=1 Tax=Streptomyces sp. CC210A TaxID=2898184 RepID=UPI001F1DD277|nr:phage tail assembly protein [Streptomyces sp. CC210A]
MASYTLDDIRSAAEARYGSTDITVRDRVVRLLNPLRLSKAKREKLTALQDQINEGADQEELLADAIRLVAEHDSAASALLAEIGEDLAVLAQVFEFYGQATQAGEA